MSWFDSGGDTLPSNKIVYSNLIRFIPIQLQERVGEENLNAAKDLEGNLRAVEAYMLKAFPQSRRRLNIQNLLDHNNQIKYTHMIQHLIKASRECNYNQQTAQQILISLMVISCTDSDMVKHFADHTEQIANMDELHIFKNFVKEQDAKFASSYAYPNYTGLGTKSAVKINKLGVKTPQGARKKKTGGGLKLDENGDPPKWMLKKGCFKGGQMGHTFHSCPNTNIIRCKTEGCKKDHNPLAHKALRNI